MDTVDPPELDTTPDDGAPTKRGIATSSRALGAWRDAKKSVWAAVVDWAVRGMLALLVVGLAMKLGLPGLLK